MSRKSLEFLVGLEQNFGLGANFWVPIENLGRDQNFGLSAKFLIWHEILGGE